MNVGAPANGISSCKIKRAVVKATARLLSLPYKIIHALAVFKTPRRSPTVLNAFTALSRCSFS